MRSRKKGFTIVELMIVIVIIGILIAIIVPSVTSAIESANIASDQSDVKNMNTILQVYCVQNGIDTTKLQAPEVRAIVSSEQKNYTFVPKSSKGIYWYSVNEGKIVYSTNGDPNNVVLSNVAHAAFTPSSPEELVEGYLYLNTGDELDEVFTALRSVINRATYNNVLAAAASVEKFTNFQAHIENFDPSHTLYISSTSMYKDGGASINNVVFATGITVIPKVETILTLAFSSGVDIVLPATVKVVEPGAFISVMSETRLVVNNSSTKVVEGALSGSIKKVANVENISYSDYKNNIQGNSLVKIQIVDETGNVIDTVTCEDASNKALYTDEALKVKIDLTKEYTVNGETQYSLREGDTSYEEKDVALASSRIIIRTEALMARYPDINAIDIKYISKKTNSEAGYNAIDIYVRAFNDSGTVVDMIITYIPA
jgi:prepilin-type N-terminal cleavage/methylation domain-containing protein